MSLRGIIVGYRIDRSFFKYGDAYRLKLGTNYYVNAICIKVEDTKVTFGYYNSKSFDILELDVDTLMYYNSYNICRLHVDYENGKFSAE